MGRSFLALPVEIGSAQRVAPPTATQNAPVNPMDQYHVWFDLKDSHKDLEFARHVEAFLGHLKREGLIVGHRMSRRKLGFGPPTIGEFHIVIETHDLAQLDEAFGTVVPRKDPVEKLHRAVYGMITHPSFALYRDFPDPSRSP